MVEEKRFTVRDVPTGKIEVVFNGVYSTLQFNCSCEDAWPVCQAMCCRLRTNYNVILKPEEIAKFKHKPLKHNPQFQILQDTEEGACTYLEDTKCGVHTTGKPWACTVFHCSPGGVGEGISFRNKGWMLAPARKYTLVDDNGTMVDWDKIYAEAREKAPSGE